MLEFLISEEDLENVDGSTLYSLYSQFNEEFERERYLMERFTRKGELAKNRYTTDDTEADPMSPYEKYTTDMAVGYFAGTPNTYFNKNNKNLRIVTRKSLNGYVKYGLEKIDKSKEDEDDEFLDYITGIYEYNKEPRENKRLTYRAFITSRAYEMVYTDENGKIRFNIIEDKCFPFKKNSISKEMIGFTRMIEYDTLDESNNHVVKRRIELYTKNRRVYYDEDDMFLKEMELPSNNSFKKGEWEIPISELVMDYGIGLFEQQIPNIRSYELVSKNSKDIENYNDNAILKISGVDFSLYNNDDNTTTTVSPDDIVTKIKSSGAIFIDSESGTDADWLIKNVSDSATENHKTNLKNDIFNTSGLFNPDTDTQVYQNQLSLQFKLYKLETKMSSFQLEFEDLINHRNKIICEIINLASSKDYEYSQIGMLFNRNIPTNMSEEINLANQLKDILPLQEIYRMLSFVESPEKTYELYKQEQLDLAELEAEKERIYNEVTMVDMYAGTMNEFDNEDNVEDSEYLDDEEIEETDNAE